MNLKAFKGRIPMGKKLRTKCCNSNTTAIISNTVSGISGFCFRCGASEFIKHDSISLADMRLAMESYVSKNTTSSVQLPKDFCRVLPKNIATWFFKYGIGDEEISKYNFGYTAELCRIVLPVMSGDTLTGVILRAIGDEKPKYLNIHKNAKAALWTTGYNNKVKRIVLTEDILSAVKTGKLIPSASLLSTMISMEKLSAIFKSFPKCEEILIWLDGDEAGIAGAKKVKASLDMIGLKNRIITTPKDPKEYSKDEIEAIIRGKHD